ncbi:hypothetical protein GH714_033072 [Hevea brasiliensis]|uniref:Ribulose bisphosphate carboxylase/oxygenase activase, chloroplastic n=1 Tax=Hevea brasiliensis TaxID=3981 RepID=A0A6A6NA33_HEVBR|nr:hypothetical protein GH714_033072 [Hevea brasiliensis]
MAKENVSDLDFVDDFHFPALFDNEENQEDFTEAKHAEEMQFQVGCVIISKMNKDNPSSVLMTGALPEPNHQEDGQPSHSFCDICAERKESITVVTCPGLNCKAVLELETCRIKLNKGVIDLWEDALCQELISVSQRFYCPYKDCSAMLVNDKEGQEISEAECPFCHRLFCARCHVPWHSGVDCEVFQKLNEDERGREDLMVMELARDQKWSRCPQCKFYVERTEADIVFDYRQKMTRSFEYLKGDYYIAPVFLDKVVCFIVKNYIAHLLNTKVPLILGIWGGKGQGKSFQTELIFQAMGIEPVIMSAGELESERAGEPGKLIRERYRTASQVVQNQGKMSCLMINDIDAGLGRFGNTQMTVNNQIVVGTLMNLSDNPTRVSIGQDWRESDVTNRVPIIVTGNDFSTIYAPLIRDGRMEKFYWQPDREDIVNIVHRMYEKDGVSRDEVISIVNTFPNQALDFYGALRSRTYDKSISKWIDDIGGVENLGDTLLKRRKNEELPVFTPPRVV